MRQITSNEIRVLKMLLCDQNDIIRHQQRRIDELEHQLEESRAKEGKGCLETAIENLKKSFSSLDFSSLISAQIEKSSGDSLKG